MSDDTGTRTLGDGRPREKARRVFVSPNQALDVVTQLRITLAGADQQRMARGRGAFDNVLKDVVDPPPANLIHRAARAQAPPASTS